MLSIWTSLKFCRLVKSLTVNMKINFSLAVRWQSHLENIKRQGEMQITIFSTNVQGY